MNQSVDGSGLEHLFLRRRALKKLLGDEALGGATFNRGHGNIMDAHSALRARALERIFGDAEDQADAERQQWENPAMRKSYGEPVDPRPKRPAELVSR